MVLQKGWTTLPTKKKSNATRTYNGKCGGGTERKLLLLPGEISQTAIEKAVSDKSTVVATNSEKSAE